MTEQATKKPEEVKKNPLQKLKEGLDDKEEQLAIIGVFVRLGVVVWTGFIVTLNYISIPGYASEPKDITFPASLLTGALASFGLEASGKKRGDGTFKVDEKDKPLSKKDIEALLLNQSGNYQTIRVETPIKLVPVEPKIDPISGKEIDPQSGKLKS